MNKKILLGSIIAVVILVLVSFTGVVGYQTTKSSTIAKASPLFKVRTQRAIGEESKVLTTKYASKGITLPFPERDDKRIMVQKVIDRIKKMDDKTFEKFISSIINNARKDNRLNNIKPDVIREVLYHFRNSDKPIPIFDADARNKYQTVIASVCCQPRVTFGVGFIGFLGCILQLLLAPFVIILIITIMLLSP